MTFSWRHLENSSLSLEGEGWGEGVLKCYSLNPQSILFPPHPNPGSRPGQALHPKGEKGQYAWEKVYG